MPALQQLSMDVLKVNEVALRQLVQQEVERVLEDRDVIAYRRIPEAQARREVETFLKQEKAKGVTRLTAFDVVRALKIPPEQAEAILEEFEQEGRLKEVTE